MMPADGTAASQKRVDATRQLPPSDFNLWKHYEDRAAQLGNELWTIGSWLFALLGATLTLPFIAAFVEPRPSYPYFELSNRLGIGVVAAFGLLLCFYSYAAMSDVREHIESNWRKAGYILEGTWQSDWRGRKGHGWNALLVIGSLATSGFVALLLLALLWPA